MTKKEKFIEIFGIEAWEQMIVFILVAEQFKEFWAIERCELEKNHD